MKNTALISLAALFLSAYAAAAACSVEYKAKRDNPTEYRHQVVNIPDDKCNRAAAERFVRQKLAQQGWTLLAIVKVSS